MQYIAMQHIYMGRLFQAFFQIFDKFLDIIETSLIIAAYLDFSESLENIENPFFFYIRNYLSHF